MPAAENHSSSRPKTATALVDLYYHDVRSHLLEAAAAFDRFERAGASPASDPRLQKLRQTATIVCDDKPDRAKRFLEALSNE